MDLNGKRVLVTGSTMGIGYAAAEGLLRYGAKVAVHGRDRKRVDDAVARLGGGANLVGVTGDTANLDDCRAMIDQAVAGLGGLDVLVNNAGIGDLSYPWDATEDHWQRVSDVNLRSAYFLTQYALPELERNAGLVIFTASAAGMSGGPTDSFVYSILKGGMISLGQALAIELAPRNVRVNILSPGYIATPLIEHENAESEGKIYEFIEACVPLRRIGTMRECASTIVYLSSDEAAYITGTVITNDGGVNAVRSWGGRN